MIVAVTLVCCVLAFIAFGPLPIKSARLDAFRDRAAKRLEQKSLDEINREDFFADRNVSPTEERLFFDGPSRPEILRRMSQTPVIRGGRP